MRHLDRLPTPPVSASVRVSTPALGDASVSATAKGIHATWEKVRFPSLRRPARVDARIGLDGDGAFKALGAAVTCGAGEDLDAISARGAQTEVEDMLAADCLPAASELVISHPDATVEAIVALQPSIEEDVVATALGRVAERIDTVQSLRELCETLDDARDPAEPTSRERIEEIARAYRPGTPGLF